MTAPRETTSPTPVARLTQLAATALLGVDRAGGTPAPAFLREAAVTAARARAGRSPRSAPAPMPECPPDPTPPVSAASASSLRRLLDQRDGELIREWVGLAAAQRQRIPDALAPTLISWWVDQRDDIPGIRPVLGTRLAWLASLNPEWQRRSAGETLPEDPPSAWESGSVGERLAQLAAIRRIEPTRAEALLRATWTKDGADDRRRFLERFGVGLSMRDEPFLEWVLDDRSKQARAVASGLLAKLPESQFAGRMLDRAAGMVSVEPAAKGGSRAKKPSLVVEPPKAWDASWERDGLEENTPRGMGQRAWWMRQVLARTPPNRLAARLGLEPVELVAGLIAAEEAEHAVMGVSDAATHLRDEFWCGVLLRHRMVEPKCEPGWLEPLWQSLPGSAREPLLLALVERRAFAWSARLGVLPKADHLWSPAFSDRVCLALLEGSLGKLAWGVPNDLCAIARRIHPAALAGYEQLVAKVYGAEPPPAVLKSIDLVRFRADMHKEFLP